MTFSLIGRCEKTNMVGVAISSSSISVASRCPWVRAGVGAASTQNVTDPSLGKLMLDYLEKGLEVTEVIDKIIKQEKNIEYRQLLLIDNKGNTSSAYWIKNPRDKWSRKGIKLSCGGQYA